MAKKPQEDIFNFTRFDGGYFTNLGDSEMEDYELLTAENCEWDGGLRKRRGLGVYATVTASITIRGAIRAYVASAWRSFVARDIGSSTVIYHQATASNAWASVNMPSGSAFSLAAGYDVQLAVLGERLVGVDGSDEPFTIYYNGASVCADTIERYGTKTRENDNWTAGFISSAGGTYTDYTTEAQDTTAANFILMTTTASTGFFVACDYTFNKIAFTNVTVTGSYPFTFQWFGYPSYGASATWNTMATSSMVQTTSLGTSTTTLNLEWPAPFVTDGVNTELAYAKLPDMGSFDSFMGGKYAVKLYGATTTVPSATFCCDYLKVYNTQYLSELLLNDKPDTVVQHKNHIFMGMGNWMRYSLADTPVTDALKEWSYDNYQIFRKGGTIKAMVPHGDYLAVMLEDKLYGVVGNSWQDWSFRELADHGCIGRRGAAVVGQLLYFVGKDGIWQWDGGTIHNVGRGIQDDLDTYTLTNTAAVNYKGELWVSFPSNETVIKADPDTFRSDNMGNSRVSWYKFNNYRVDGWLYCSGDSDLGYLLGWANNTTPVIVRADNGSVDFITATASIDWVFRSKNYDFGEEHRVKQYRRFKPVLADASECATTTATGCLYQFTFISKNNYGSTTANATVTVSACSSGIFETDLTLPHTLDGKRLSVYMRHSATTTAKLYGYTFGVRERWF